MNIFQIHKNGKNVSGDTSYPSLELASAALSDAPGGAEVVGVDISSGTVVRRYTAEESREAARDFRNPRI